MGEQIAVEGRVVVEEIAQVQRGPGRRELVEADLARSDLGPVALPHELMLGVGRSLADCLEDHAPMLAAVPLRSRPGRARLDERNVTTAVLLVARPGTPARARRRRPRWCRWQSPGPSGRAGCGPSGRARPVAFRDEGRPSALARRQLLSVVPGR